MLLPSMPPSCGSGVLGAPAGPAAVPLVVRVSVPRPFRFRLLLGVLLLHQASTLAIHFEVNGPPIPH